MTERSSEEPPEGHEHDPPQWGTPGPAESAQPTYGPPATYGPPPPHAAPAQYGPPPQYGPPATYGPPPPHSQPPQYGPPPPHSQPPQYGPPYEQSAANMAQPAPAGQDWSSYHHPAGIDVPRRPRKPLNTWGVAALVLTFMGGAFAMDVGLFAVGMIMIAAAWGLSVASFFRKDRELGTSVGAFFLAIIVAVGAFLIHMGQVIG